LNTGLWPIMPILRGWVLRSGEEPVAEARVSFVSGPVPLPEIAALTNREGRFELNPRTAGTYRLRATSDEHGSGELEITVGLDGKDGFVIHLR